MNDLETKSAVSRLRQLDLLRGVAILLVMGHHPVVEARHAGSFAPLAALWYRFGWTGVDLFFVLSGFLVGGLLLKEYRDRSGLDVRRFIIRRGFKIWPSYLLYIAVLTAALAIHNPASARAMLPSFLHVQNYLGSAREHLWSLAVEEHFYLLLPLVLLYVTARHRLDLVPWIAGSLMALCLAFRLVTYAFLSFRMESHFYATHLRVDSLFFGVLLAYLHHFRPKSLERYCRRRGILIAAGIALVSPMALVEIRSGPFVPVIGVAMLTMGYAAVLLALLHTPSGVGWLGRALESRPARGLAFVGYFSYPIYLWHVDLARIPLQHALAGGGFLGGSPGLRWLLVGAIGYPLLATAAGVFMGAVVEKPALSLRDRWFPARASALRDPLPLDDAERPAVLSNPVEPGLSLSSDASAR